jgi:hypothetical protein
VSIGLQVGGGKGRKRTKVKLAVSPDNAKLERLECRSDAVSSKAPCLSSLGDELVVGHSLSWSLPC